MSSGSPDSAAQRKGPTPRQNSGAQKRGPIGPVSTICNVEKDHYVPQEHQVPLPWPPLPYRRGCQAGRVQVDQGKGASPRSHYGVNWALLYKLDSFSCKQEFYKTESSIYTPCDKFQVFSIRSMNYVFMLCVKHLAFCRNMCDISVCCNPYWCCNKGIFWWNWLGIQMVQQFNLVGLIQSKSHLSAWVNNSFAQS